MINKSRYYNPRAAAERGELILLYEKKMELQVRFRFLLQSSVIDFYVVVTDYFMLHTTVATVFFSSQFLIASFSNFTMRMHVVFVSCNVDKISLGNVVCLCVHSRFSLQIGILWRIILTPLFPCACHLPSADCKNSASVTRKS